MAQSSIGKLMSDPDRETRRAAWRSYCDGFIEHENSLTASLCTAVRRDMFMARGRRFDSLLESALFEGNVPCTVYDSTIEAFKANLPVWHRYWRVRRKALGLESIEHCDIWAPIAEKQLVIPYAEAVERIARALDPLGDECVADLRGVV